MLGSLNSSTTINIAKVAGDIDISLEAIKWRAEFGDELGRKVESYVLAAMDDYEYMKLKRLEI
jgi:hypothetical protein